MKCRIVNGVLVVDAESTSEIKELKKWREGWQAKPKKEKWFQCNYYNPIQTIVI